MQLLQPGRHFAAGPVKGEGGGGGGGEGGGGGKGGVVDKQRERRLTTQTLPRKTITGRYFTGAFCPACRCGHLQL